MGLSENNDIVMILLMHLLPVLDREAGKKPDESRCSLWTFPQPHTKESFCSVSNAAFRAEVDREFMAICPIARGLVWLLVRITIVTSEPCRSSLSSGERPSPSVPFISDS